MRTEVLLKCALMTLIVALAVALTSWIGSESNEARAQSGGAAGNWILVTSTIQNGEGVLYMFNAEREVLLVYAFYRRSGAGRGSSRYQGDLEFLAGRHCKWDSLYSQQRLFPYAFRKENPPSGVATPKVIKQKLQAIQD